MCSHEIKSFSMTHVTKCSSTSSSYKNIRRVIAASSFFFVLVAFTKEYSSNVPIWSLRVIPALAGSFSVPLAYLLTVELGCSHFTALGASVLLILGKCNFPSLYQLPKQI